MNLNNIFEKKKRFDELCPPFTNPNGLGNCIPKECGEGFQYKSGRCVQTRPDIVKSNQSAADISNETTPIQKCLTKSRNGFNVFIFQNTLHTLYNITNDHVQIFNKTWKVQFKNKTLTILSWIQLANGSIDLKELLDQTAGGKNILKIVLTSSTLHQSSYYGFDTTRAFDESKLCASVIKIPNVNRSKIIYNNCTAWFKNVMNVKENITLNDINFHVTFYNGTIDEAAFYCQQPHLHTSCFRENINPKNFTIGVNKTLSFFASDGQHFEFQANEYIPTVDGFQICLRNNTTHYHDRQEEFSYLTMSMSLSFIGISIFASVFFIMIFMCIKEMRNTGGMYILVLVIILLTSDIIFLVSLQLDPYTDGCKWVGILVHWALLLLFAWTIVVSVDITLQFSRNSTTPVKCSNKRLCVSFASCLLISVMIIGTILALNETETLDFRYEEHCWLMDYHLFLGFFYIPAVLSYSVCLLCLLVVLYSIRKSKRHVKQTLGDSVNQHNIHLAKICIKLIIILGISESISLVQIHGSELTDSEQILNKVFLTMYDVVRSLRGLMICCVYLSNRRSINLMKNKWWTKHTNSETG